MVMLRLSHRAVAVVVMHRIVVPRQPVNGRRRRRAEQEQCGKPDGTNDMQNAGKHMRGAQRYRGFAPDAAYIGDADAAADALRR